MRVHKFVHFYLLEYKSGDVADHDFEVNEARWVGIDEAIEMLAFKSEKSIVESARKMIQEQHSESLMDTCLNAIGSPKRWAVPAELS